MVIDDTGSVEGIYAFIYCTKWRSGQGSRMPTQLLIKYKSGALVTQKHFVTRKLDIHIYMITVADDITFTTLLLLFLNQVLDTAHRWWFDRCGSGREAPGTSGGKCLAG